LSAVFVNTVP